MSPLAHVFALAAAASMVLAGAGAAEAKPLVHEHYSDSDSFELQLTTDSSEEVDIGAPSADVKSGHSGINLGKPSDSGVSLEKKGPKSDPKAKGKKAEKDSDSDVDFELSLDPSVMLFDEPTSALDAELGVEVLNVMRKLAADGMTMIVVTHALHFAEDVSDRVVVMDRGKIIESGPPVDVLRNPTNPRTRRFLSAVLER